MADLLWAVLIVGFALVAWDIAQSKRDPYEYRDRWNDRW